jgi:hypothetical protein
MNEVNASVQVPASPHYTAVITSTVALRLFAYHVAQVPD